MALDEFDEKWGKKNPLAVKSWRANWVQLSTMFKYSPEIRKMIYTTNAIENFNRQLLAIPRNSKPTANSKHRYKLNASLRRVSLLLRFPNSSAILILWCRCIKDPLFPL